MIVSLWTGIEEGGKKHFDSSGSLHVEADAEV
jgi:hypothetical protein